MNGVPGPRSNSAAPGPMTAPPTAPKPLSQMPTTTTTSNSNSGQAQQAPSQLDQAAAPPKPQQKRPSRAIPLPPQAVAAAAAAAAAKAKMMSQLTSRTTAASSAAAINGSTALQPPAGVMTSAQAPVNPAAPAASSINLPDPSATGRMPTWVGAVETPANAGSAAGQPMTVQQPGAAPASEDPASERCSNCRAINNLSWRRHPTTNGVLCHQCSLHITLYGKDRPVRGRKPSGAAAKGRRPRQSEDEPSDSAAAGGEAASTQSEEAAAPQYRSVKLKRPRTAASSKASDFEADTAENVGSGSKTHPPSSRVNTSNQRAPSANAALSGHETSSVKRRPPAVPVIIPASTDGPSPPAWTEVFSNVYMHRSRRRVANEEVEVCSCSLQKGQCCGPHDQCLNRSVFIECTRGHCKCGDSCRNQALQRRDLPDKR